MRPRNELMLEAAARQGSDLASRRGVLALAGIMAAAPAVLGVETAAARKKDKNDKKDKKDNRRNKDKKRKANARKSDIAVLNYALTLEHLEYAFYRDGLDQFTAGDFDPGVYERLEDIRDHEQAHVDTLISVITSLGGTPVEELCYDFGANTATAFLGVAQALENTGVSAYDGAIARIKTADLQTAGATIATVEARHAAYLNQLNGDNPFPDAFDTPLTEDEILAIAGPFIVACP